MRQFIIYQPNQRSLHSKQGEKENKIVQLIKLKQIIVILVKCSFTRTSII